MVVIIIFPFFLGTIWQIFVEKENDILPYEVSFGNIYIEVLYSLPTKHCGGGIPFFLFELEYRIKKRACML